MMLFEVHFKNVSDISEDQSSSGQDVSYQARILGQKLPSWAKVAKLGKSCKVGEKLPSWAFFCNDDDQVLDTSLGLTTGASPAASWWLLQSQNQGSCNDNFETTLRQPDGLHSTEAGPRSGAVPRVGRRPAGCGSRPQRSGGEDGREEHASTLHHFVALCDNVWHFVTLCNTLVTLVHRLCCTHGRVANSWQSSISTTSGWPGSTGLPGRSRENNKL